MPPINNGVVECRHTIISSPARMFTVIKLKQMVLCSDMDVRETETWAADVTGSEIHNFEPFFRN